MGSVPHMFRASDILPRAGAETAAFPYGLAARGVHEVAAAGHGDLAGAAGFALAAGAASGSSAVLWVSLAARTRELGAVSLDGLAACGLAPDRWLEVCATKPREALWAVEEAIHSGAVERVVAELDTIDFTASRRLTLASAARGVPVVLLLGPACEGASAAEARWRVSALASAPNRFDPRAPGRPRWQAVLERARSAPAAAGRCHTVEFDDDTRTCRLVSRLADRAPAPQPAPRHRQGSGDALRPTG